MCKNDWIKINNDQHQNEYLIVQKWKESVTIISNKNNMCRVKYFEKTCKNGWIKSKETHPKTDI